jgi:EmrB/QacA subfamily drug resistance transporter
VAARLPCDVGVIAGAPAANAPCTRMAGRLVLIATIVASSMVFIDGTVVNIALPVIQLDLHATATDVQWIVNAYTLFLASLMLVGGSLGDYYGRKRVFIIGTIVFGLSSVWCGLAPDVHHLILARGVQGVGSAMLTPGSLALISATFDREQRGRAIGTWSGMTAVMAAIGPALGGWIVQHASWRWIFFINVPLALVVLVVASFGIAESSDGERTHRLDYAGALLATLGLGALTYGLISASAVGLSDPLVIGALLVGAATLIVFVWLERRLAKPMLPPQLFRSRTFSGVNLLTLLLYGALSGVLFFLPFNLIQMQHYTPTAAGLAMLPFIALIVVLSPWAGGLVARVGPRLPLVIGPALAGLGIALFAMPGIGGSYWSTFFPGIVVLGFGMAVTVAPLTTTVLESVDAEHVGIASAINNAVSRAAGLFAVAVFSLIVLGVFNTHLDRRLTAMNASPQVVAEMAPERIKLAAAQPPADMPPALRDELRDAIDVSYLAGFRVAMVLAALLAVAGAGVAAFSVRGRRTN